MEASQNHFSQQFPCETNNNITDQFIVEDLLDFSNDNDSIIIDPTFDSVPDNSSSITDPISISDSTSFDLLHPHLCPHLSLPDDDDIAEMEWLSNFVEESFSCEDLQKLELLSGIKARNDDTSKSNKFHLKRNNLLEVFVPTKARSKRPYMPPSSWISRLLVFAPMTSLYLNPNFMGQTRFRKKLTKVGSRKRDVSDSSSDGRKCMHCATDKTPQWRTGPMGPKTLCNACGVRYKSGRLVPEYRPASSPTFVLAKHSNSHRKVLELRRQKEIIGESNNNNNNSCNIIFHT